MADSDINMERFAHDVCVHVLEKFGIFKAPDDTRKQNKYMSYDFLSCVSRSVVTYSIFIRDDFKNALEDKYKTADPTNQEEILNFFYDKLLQSDMFARRNSAGKVCISLASCTEYIQFVSRKDFRVSLNKLVIRWSDFFEKNLRVNFEAEGGFLKMHSNLKSSQMDHLDDYHKAFISEYCLPYGAREGIMELARKCAEKHDIPLHVVIFGVKTTVGMSEEQSKTRCSEESQSNLPGSQEPKRGETSDSEDPSSDSVSSENTDSGMSQNIESEASDTETSQNNLLGIPPHEDMLREIDPFFVENIPSPPKPQSASKSPEPQAGSSDGPRSASKSPERHPGSSDTPCSSPEQKELQEKVDQILTTLEHDMQSLRALLFEHGLLSMKSGRRGSRMQIKDAKGKFPPKGPEGLI